MSKYSSLVYGQSYYGQKSRLAFSVSPFTAVTLDYNSVQLNWSAPVGGYTAFRVLRNQEGFSETVEDGAVIYEEFNIDGTSGTVSISTLLDEQVDGTIPALVGGKFAFYRIWILKAADAVWYPAGETYVLIPNAHPTYGPNKITLQTTHDRTMSLLPKVFTSASQSSIDEFSADTDLYRFMEAFSFTVDELVTLAETLLPNYAESKTSPAVLWSKSNQLGLTPESTLATKNQKRMIREALYMYSRKGTVNSLQTLVESVTGYNSDITVSPNLMLTNADSTFNGGLGFWLPIGNCTIGLENVNPVTSETHSIDKTYSAKVVVSTANAKIVNGADSPVKRGIPVVAETEYRFSYYVQTASGTKGVTPTIYWYDYAGTVISSNAGSSSNATTTWSKKTLTATAPEEAVYASIELVFGATGTYYVDMVQFSESTVTDYHEARAAYVFLYPRKNNYLLNPSFETNLANWTITTGTATKITGNAPNYDLTGGHIMQISSGNTLIKSAATQGIVPTNSYVTFSGYTKTVTGTTAATVGITATTYTNVTGYSITSNVAELVIASSPAFQVGDTVTIANVATAVNGTHTITGVNGANLLVEITASDVALTTVTGTVTKSMSTVDNITIVNDWNRFQTRMFLPDTWSQQNTTVSVTLLGNLAQTVYLDATQLEPTFVATDYFDGTYGTERDALWAGTPGNSNSYLYPNKIINISRLTEELPKFLPQDTPYIISSYSGTEASGFSQ